MSKITRDKLSRGTLLASEHIFRPLRNAASELNANVEASQLETPNGTFRVNHHFPVIGGTLFGTVSNTSSSFASFMMPMTFPPLQEFFDGRGHMSSSTPPVILDEFSFSFDQRDESAVLRDVNDATADGNLNYDEVANSRYDIKLRLMEKEMTIFNPSASYVPDREVFSVELPAESFTSKTFRLNPYIITDLNKTINPYKSYTLFIEAPNITKDAINKFAFVSFQTSAKFRHPLVDRDRWSPTSQIQNMPMKHSGSKSGESITIQEPASGTLILADGAEGISTNVETIEQVFLDKLKGGYSQFSERYVAEHISDDATYDVISIPMFGGLGTAVTASSGQDNVIRLPYVGSSPFTAGSQDRRIIPIIYPFTVHHVIAARTWCATPAAGNMKPTGSNFITTINVGIGEGLQSDKFGYQEIAYASFNQTQTGSYQIDRIKQRVGGQMTTAQGDLASQDFDVELFHIPLVYYKDKNKTTHLGTSYPLTGSGVYTGNPVYVGKSWLGTDNRTEIATTASGSAGYSKVAGREQFLEVRWQIRDSVDGFGNTTYYPNGTVFCGYGGNYIHLICKKHLV